MRKCTHRTAFTLIELLVVVAIIAILLAVVLPSLKRVKEAGKRITCMSNLRGLSQIMLLYTGDFDGKVPSGNTEGAYAWVNHIGLAYYNINNDPALEEQQREAIRRGPLWPYCGGAIDVFRCPTGRLGQARSYSMPDSFNYVDIGLLALTGATESMLIKNIATLRNTAGRMLFLDEGWATPSSWTIFYNAPRWWDIVPERHASGTTLAFADGHTEYWKWEDERTRTFSREAMAMANPNDATYWRRVEPGNEDIRRLVTAVWGKVGWTGDGTR